MAPLLDQTKAPKKLALLGLIGVMLLLPRLAGRSLGIRLLARG